MCNTGLRWITFPLVSTMSVKSGLFKNTFRASYKPTFSSKRKLSSSNDTAFEENSVSDFDSITSVLRLYWLHTFAQICPISPKPTIATSY